VLTTATCHTCNWTSLDYVKPANAHKAADKHQSIYHARQANIISITKKEA